MGNPLAAKEQPARLQIIKNVSIGILDKLARAWQIHLLSGWSKNHWGFTFLNIFPCLRSKTCHQVGRYRPVQLY
jgi:hypothetical protein